jgi:hypothetical protein
MRKKINLFLFIYSLGARVRNKKYWSNFFFRSYEFLPTPELELFELEYSLAPESGIL